MEYCQFSSSWSTNQNFNYITKYSLLQTKDEWVDNDLNADDTLIHDSDIHQMTLTATETNVCELTVTCKPHYNVRILGICIVTEARTVECYSKMDGYLESSRGVPIDLCDDGEVDKKLYHSRLKLESPMSEVTFKFLGLGDKTMFRICKLKFVLLQDEVDKSFVKSHPGSIDVAKVKGYLHSMGDCVPENALELLQSVEQYQKTQMSGLQNIQNMFAGLNIGPAGDSGLSNLFSVVSKLGPRPKDGQKLEHEASFEGQSNSAVNSHSEGTDMKPLENLARSLSQSEGHLDFEGQGSENMMYKMLQNICGSVSKMRDLKIVQQDEGTQDNEDVQPKSSSSHSEEAKTETASAVTRTNTEEFQTTIEQTVSQIFLSTEQRLKDYIDTSLHALEDRLNQKLDMMFQKLENNTSLNVS